MCTGRNGLEAFEELLGGRLPGERLGPLGTNLPVQQQSGSYSSREIFIQDARHTWLDDIDGSWDGKRRDGDAAGESLDHGEPERIGQARKDEHVGGAQHGCQLITEPIADEPRLGMTLAESGPR